ncbi:MAG: efflux RND transporter permease subunit [Clostridiales bacterium]|nr:efflux RND transporter permease subunit [Candidatus Blautia equi]
MLSRLSVKKPYTVWVAIVLVIILGAVSFGKMNTDLLPSMNLPYAIVMTTYPGASPETVETVVTRPIEQSMATVSDIENVSSQSRENVSVVILEFAESTNMDSVTIEIREKLDQISGYWDDMVGKPMIMKLNPDMLPIMIAAVEIDDLEATEVTDYVKAHIEAELESVAGVASVSTTGNITESVNITIRQDKIAEVNKKIAAAVDKTFAEKEEELEDAQKELDNGKEELEDGKKQMEDGKAALESGKNAMVAGLAGGKQQLADAQSQLSSGAQELRDTEKMLNEQQKQLTDGLEAITNGRQQAIDGKAQLIQAQTGIETLVSAINMLQEKEDELSGPLTTMEQGMTAIDQQIALLEAAADVMENGSIELPGGGTIDVPGIGDIEIPGDGTIQLPGGGTIDIPNFGGGSSGGNGGSGDDFADDFVDDFADDYIMGYSMIDTPGVAAETGNSLAGQTQNLLQQLYAQKAELQTQYDLLKGGITEIKTQKASLQSQLDSILSGLGKTSASEALSYIATQITTIDQTLQELTETEAQLLEGQSALDAGFAQLNAAKQQVASGQSQLTTGQIAMDTQSLLAVIQMSVAEAKLASGEGVIAQTEAQLDAAQTQLDDGREQLNDAKEQTKEKVDLNNILSKDLVKGILAGQNFSMPAGYINEGQDEFLVRVGDKLRGMDNMEDLILLDLGFDDLDPIRLGDVAEIIKVDDSDSVYARLNGSPGVILTLEKQTGYSTGDVTDRLLKRIDEIEEERENVHFSVLMNQGIYIDLVVNSVLQNMMSGALLAVLILLLFLKDLRPTFVIACSIPISVVTAFVLMYFSGITLNVISLSGLALGIGMLVDNSIVVIENIDRLRQKGMSAVRAAVEGAGEVAGAIAASTLTTVCVFAPIVFTEGITRQLFVDMGLTIAYSLLASLVVALTLVPAMSSGLLRKTKPKKAPLLEFIKKIYGTLLSGALHVKFLVVLLAAGLLVWSGYIEFQNGTAFMPDMESTQVTMTISMEKGAQFADLVKNADDVIAAIEDIEDIESIGAMAGGGGLMSLTGGGGSGNSITAYLLLKEDKKLSGEELADEIYKRTEQYPCNVSVSTQSMDMSALGGSGISVRVKGRELDRLAEICRDIAKMAEEVEGLVNVSDGQGDVDREFRISVDKGKAMEHQLTVAQVFQAIQVRLAEASSATTLATEDKDYSVYVYDEKDETLTRDLVKEMEIDVKNKEGETEKIKLSEIASFDEATGPQTITRDAQSRYMTVSGQIASGHNIAFVSAALNEKLEDYELPGGYSIEMTGEDETINDAMEQLFLMLALAVVFMYLIMVAQFQSLMSPFIVMFTIPLAFTGGFLGLKAANMELSVIAMIGFIMLSGIIVNNGIVLVDYTNQLRMEGMEKRAALIQAGKDRLRPIVMTALTTILGLSTMAAGTGMGSDMVQPMAIVTIGGLIYGTVLTLFVVPCIYDMLNRKEYKRDELSMEEEAANGTDRE